jgi:hypothetical protein
MRARRLATVLVIAFTSGCARGQRVASEDIAHELEAVIADVPVRNYATCQLRSGIWGDYRTTVEVDGTVTTDKKPRSFRVEKGRLFVATEASGPAQAVAVRRWGQVQFASAEEAFAKGAPFFIRDVAFQPPDVITYTVVSNPAQPIDRAVARLELRREADDTGGFLSHAEIIETPKPLHSTAEPQARVWKGWTHSSSPTLLSIVRGSAMAERCLLSNEIPLN